MAKRPHEDSALDDEELLDSSGEAGPSTLPTLDHDEPEPSRRFKPSKKKHSPNPGIVYISRLPPGMTPQKVRHLMAKWGDVGKVYAQRRDGRCSSLSSAGADLCSRDGVRLTS